MSALLCSNTSRNRIRTVLETSEFPYRFDYRFAVSFSGTCGGMAWEVSGVLRTMRAREECRRGVLFSPFGGSRRACSDMSTFRERGGSVRVSARRGSGLSRQTGRGDHRQIPSSAGVKRQPPCSYRAQHLQRFFGHTAGSTAEKHGKTVIKAVETFRGSEDVSDSITGGVRTRKSAHFSYPTYPRMLSI